MLWWHSLQPCRSSSSILEPDRSSLVPLLVVDPRHSRIVLALLVALATPIASLTRSVLVDSILVTAGPVLFFFFSTQPINRHAANPFLGFFSHSSIDPYRIDLANLLLFLVLPTRIR